MLRLIFNAIGSRRTQSLTVLALCALAVAVAMIGPLYALNSVRIAIGSDIAATPVAAHTLSVIADEPSSTDGAAMIRDFDDAIAHALPLRTGPRTNGVATYVDVKRANDAEPVHLLYADGVCSRLRITGACPSRPGDILVTTATAALFGDLHVGSRLQASTAEGIATYRITGTYTRASVFDTYWQSPLFTGKEATETSSQADAVFTTLGTLASAEIDSVTIVMTTPVPPSTFVSETALPAKIRLAAKRLAAHSVPGIEPRISPELPALADRIAADRKQLQAGIVVPMVEILGLCWFALFLATRFTAQERRSDTGLLKLRGSTWWTLVRLSVGQGMWSTAGGFVLGAGIAYAADRYWAPLRGASRSAWPLAGAAALVTLAGAVVVIVIAEWRAGKEPVVDLLRRVPARRRGLRADIVDLVVVALAAMLAFQAWIDPQSVGAVAFAPALVALAVALLCARLIIPVAVRAGACAMRAGRLRIAISALQVARRPAADRVFVLLVISAALLSTAALSYSAGARLRDARAVIDVGTGRVLTVQAPNPVAFLHGVRAADPGGRSAMAALQLPSDPALDGLAENEIRGPILAVDAARLGAVAQWTGAYGATTAARTAAELITPAQPSVLVQADSLTLDITNGPTTNAYLRVDLVNQTTGATSQIDFGPFAASRRQTEARPLIGCTASPCRLVWMQDAGHPTSAGQDTYPERNRLVIHSLSTPSGPVAGPDVLGDITRLRTAINPDPGVPLAVSTTDGELSIGTGPKPPPIVPQVPPPIDYQIFVADSPAVLPAVMAGGSATDLTIQRQRVNAFDGVPLNIHITDVAPALPALGASGILVDLPSLLDATPPGLGVYQIWVAPGAPAPVLARLKGLGWPIVSDVTVASDRAELAHEGPAAARMFQLIVAAVGVVLAGACLLAVASSERRSRATEIAVLRAQGLSARSASMIGYGGYGVFVVAAVVAGFVAACVSYVLVRLRVPFFVDSWTVLAPPEGIAPVPLLLSGLLALIVFGTVAFIAARTLIRRARVAGPS